MLLTIAAIAIVYFIVGRLLRFIRSKPKLPVLITGCDTGFGNSASKQLAAKGVTVLAGCLTSKGVEDLQQDKTGNIIPFQVNVTDQKSVDAVAAVLKARCPNGLHAIINNAGVLRTGILEISPIEDLEFQFQVNVCGMARMTKVCMPYLRKSRGRIINVASIAGRFGMQALSFYCATKHAVEGMSDGWRREMKSWGISVTVIEPGAMKTPLYETMANPATLDAQWNALSPEIQETYGRKYFEAGHTEMMRVLGELSGDPKQVVDAMEEVVFAVFPPHRRPVGLDANFLVMPMANYFPSWLADLVAGALARERVRPQALQ